MQLASENDSSNLLGVPGETKEMIDAFDEDLRQPGTDILKESPDFGNCF
jgi:hypothetical protein